MDGLLGRLDTAASTAKPAGDDSSQAMRVTADQADGIPFGFTTYRESDLTGFYPKWREFSYNVGDVDDPPIGVPMGPRHFSIYATPAQWGR